MTTPRRPDRRGPWRSTAIVAGMGALVAAIPLICSMVLGSSAGSRMGAGSVHGLFHLLFGGTVPQLLWSWSAPRVIVHDPGFPGWPHAWWLVPVAFLGTGTLATLLFRCRSTVGGDLSVVLPIVAGWHLLWIIRLVDLASLLVRTIMSAGEAPGPADDLMPMPIVIGLCLHVAGVAALWAISLRHRASDRPRTRVVILSLWVLWIGSLGFPPLL